jgi:hypothetical protein
MHISLDSALGQQRRLNSVGESITQIAPDPAAAYSLRSLTGSDPKVVRVRRGSDNHEQDFTASDVSSGALQDFVNAQVVAPLDIQALSATGRDGDFLIAKAAYSLRSLGTRQATLAATGDTVARADGKYVCQVRRSSDDALKSFTATEVTDGTLLAFTNEDVVVYSSDYSSGTDSWAFSGGSLAAPQSIGGEDNALKVTLSGDGFFFPQKTGVLVSGETYSISLKLYAPSDNTNSNLNFNVRESGGGTVLDCNLTEANAWQSFTVSLTSSTTQVLQVTSDVSMTSGDVLYIKDFVVTQTSNSSGFVKTWYDQSVTTQAGDTATGNHATQATAGNQPKIVDAGSLLADGIEFDGSNDRLVSSNGITVTTSSDISFSLVGESDDITATQTIVSQKSGTGQGRSWTDIVSSNFRTSIGGSAKTFGSVSANGTPFIYSFILDESANTGDAFKDGSQSGSQQSISAAEAANGELVIGSNNGESGQFFNGHLEELIVYLSDQTDNRTAIEANMGEAYSIDLPSGVDPGFDQVDGFVETWYDQSGNSKDATQTTAANQPKIVNAGALVVDSGIGGLDFDGDDFLTASSVSGLEGSISMFAVSVRDATGYVVSPSNSSAANRYFGIQEAASTVVANPRNTSNKTVSDSASGADRLTFAVTTGATSTSVGSNGSAVTTTTNDYGDDFSGSNLDQIAIGILRTVSASGQFNGRIREILVYSSDQTDNRTAVETNINGHYSIF